MLALADKKRVHTLVAKVLYLATRTRVDLLLTVAFLTTRVQAPTEEDKIKLIRVFKYLNYKRNLPIVFGTDGNSDNQVMEAYVDASFGTHNFGFSHTGAVVLYAGGPIFTKSCRQKVVSKSSYEAELVSLSAVGTDIIHLRNFMLQQS
jgi:hypothetical protein